MVAPRSAFSWLMASISGAKAGHSIGVTTSFTRA